jgi:hypothetical protein
VPSRKLALEYRFRANRQRIPKTLVLRQKRKAGRSFGVFWSGRLLIKKRVDVSE